MGLYFEYPTVIEMEMPTSIHSLYVLFLSKLIGMNWQGPCFLGESRDWTGKDLRRSSEAFARADSIMKAVRVAMSKVVGGGR